MILAGSSVHVIILEHPETCSVVQFSVTALGLCLWTCHFSNPEILPMTLRHSSSECCVGCGSSCKEQFLCQGCFWGPSWGLWLRTDGVSRCGTPLNFTGCLSLPHCWHGSASSWLAQGPPGGCGGVLGTQGTPRGRARLGQARADPDPATRGPRVQLWFGFHSHPAH